MILRGNILIYNEKLRKQICVDDIVKIESCLGNYCMVHLATKRIMISYCVKRFIELLDNRLFLRISKACVVQRKLVSLIDDGRVYVKDKHIATFSRRYLKAYREQ